MEETTVSTPVDTTVEDTSTNVEPTNVDTSTVEPDTENETAETETNAEETQTQEPKLYAGKYKSVEELEKGYSETQKFVTKAAEFEQKYNELLNKQTQETQKAEQARLQQAQQRGFNSVEQAEIADKVQLAEFEYYANGINQIDPQYFEPARASLLQYYQTGNANYLKDAKRYFSSDFIENATTQKNLYKARLEQELGIKTKQAQNAREEKLAEEIKAQFKDFLADNAENVGKTNSLKMFCNAGFINSVEDMKNFQALYDQIASYERKQAIKEYEASKTIEQAKDGAQIASNANTVISSAMPTASQLADMSQEDYEAAVNKYGLDKLIK